MFDEKILSGDWLDHFSLNRLQHIKYKLMFDNPWFLLQKEGYRHYRKLRNWRRRKYWQDFTVKKLKNEGQCEYSIDNFEKLWPGAADKSWISKFQELHPKMFFRSQKVAEDAKKGVFNLLGSGPVDVSLPGGSIKWHQDFKTGVDFPSKDLYLDVPICLQKGTDIKVPWELSRFQHVFAFILMGEESYRNAFVKQWLDWREKNPAAKGVNWACAMDVGLRAISLTAAMAAWGRTFEKEFSDTLVLDLICHGHFIYDNLEWSCRWRTNHYFTDLVALAVIASLLESYNEAPSWRRFATKELNKEINEQFAEDGFNKECSTTYHRLMVELATLACLAIERGGHHLEQKALDRIEKAYMALDLLTDENGRMPIIGDNDSSRVYPMTIADDCDVKSVLSVGKRFIKKQQLSYKGDMFPEAALLFGSHIFKDTEEIPAAQKSKTGQLKDSGLFVIGNKESRIVIKCGPLSYKPTGGHRHLDQLSISLAAKNTPVIIDPGQFCYTPDIGMRNKFRYSDAHNTVLVDGQQQNRVFAKTGTVFSIVNEDRPELTEYEDGSRCMTFEGIHRGYCRIEKRGIHRRKIIFDKLSCSWTLIDTFNFTGLHDYQWFFHLAKNTVIEQYGNTFKFINNDVQICLDMDSDGELDFQMDDFPVSCGYGRMSNSKMLVCKKNHRGALEQKFVLTMEDGENSK